MFLVKSLLTALGFIMFVIGDYGLLGSVIRKLFNFENDNNIIIFNIIIPIVVRVIGLVLIYYCFFK
ncbi:hypothetical protein [Clostridium thermobutyricum]|uniref:hypothetical protein n=1 Tax=Clostridium thermobutyricum TaxID=29372 RepID=UPI0018AA828D|nr:hypothetical protein [Clostridium thermobutyricum]